MFDKLRVLASRIRGFFAIRRLDRDFVQELDSHLAMLTDENIRRGMPPAEARRAARLRLGNPAQLRESHHDLRSLPFLESVLADIRFALRMLRKSPGFTAIAVLTLALGIGANTAIFSLTDQVLLRFLPVVHPEQLVVLKSPGPNLPGHTMSGWDSTAIFSYPMYKDLRDNNPVFSGLLARFPIVVSVIEKGETEMAQGELVSGNYFDVLGVNPALGRVLAPQDETAPGANPVALLSYAYWLRRFGGNPDILNQSLIVSGTSLTVVGVSRPGFSGIQVGQSPDIFIPITMKPQMMPTWNGLEDRKDRWVVMLGRLKPTFTRERAEAALQPSFHAILGSDVESAATPVPDAFRKRYIQKHIALMSGAHGLPVLQQDQGTPIIVLMAMVGLVLLIACTNLAGLLVARGEARQREIGVRLALGATRFRVARQLFTETLLFTLAGSVVGIALASVILKVLAEPLADGFNFSGFETQLDFRILAFAIGLSILSALLFGLVPAMRAPRHDLNLALQGQGAGPSGSLQNVRIRRWMITSQIALATVLLAAAALFARSLVSLKNVDLGLRIDHLIELSIAPELSRYTPVQTISLGDRLTQTIKALPGVRSVSAANIRVLADTDSGSNITVEDYPAQAHENMNIRENWVGPGYFATMGTALIRGREFTESDNQASQKVAVINEKMARRFFPGRDPIGLHFAPGNAGDAQPKIEIVGVVQDSKHATVGGNIDPYAYLPYAQDADLGQLTFYVRTAQSPEALASTLKKVVEAAAPGVPVFDVRTLEEQRDENIFAARLMALLAACFGILASLLGAIGLYGVMAYMVALRIRELGIRVALGASRGNVAWLVLREALEISIMGLIVGIPAAFAAGRLIRSQLFEVKPNDPWIFATAAVLLLIVVMLAAWLPARRAMRVDPMVALRHE